MNGVPSHFVILRIDQGERGAQMRDGERIHKAGLGWDGGGEAMCVASLGRQRHLYSFAGLKWRYGITQLLLPGYQ